MKHEELVLQISKHHIIILTETRTNETQRLLQYLPEHTLIGQTHIPTGYQGLKGYGVAVLASNQVAEFCSLQKTIQNIQGLWIRCDKRLFDLEEDVLMCATYLNPQSSTRPAQEIDNLFYTLGEEILLAKTVTPHVIICGDFNAHIGCLNELLFPTPPHLPQDVLSRHHSPCEFPGYQYFSKPG